MTRLANLLSGLCEVINAVAVRAEDVIGEWVDNWGPSPSVRGPFSWSDRNRLVRRFSTAIDELILGRINSPFDSRAADELKVEVEHHLESVLDEVMRLRR